MARQTREQTTRAATPTHPEEFDFDGNEYFTQSNLLTLPKPPPDKVYRWVRVGRSGGAPDIKNTQRRTTLEHWTPIDPATLTQYDGNFVDMRVDMRIRDPKNRSSYKTVPVIQVDDLVAMERPKELQERARRANRERNRKQEEAINAKLSGETRANRDHGYTLEPEYRTRETRGTVPDVIDSAVNPEDVL